MKHVIGAFSILFVLLLNVFLCIGMITVNADVAAAKEYKAAVVAEIENSNFNPKVIQGCIAQAAEAGYTLQVLGCSYDAWNEVQMAEVILSYTYCIPVLGISETKTTRGIAR